MTKSVSDCHWPLPPGCRNGCVALHPTHPQPDGWCDHTCGYVLHTDACTEDVTRARSHGWPEIEPCCTQLELVTHPNAVIRAPVELAGQLVGNRP